MDAARPGKMCCPLYTEGATNVQSRQNLRACLVPLTGNKPFRLLELFSLDLLSGSSGSFQLTLPLLRKPGKNRKQHNDIGSGLMYVDPLLFSSSQFMDLIFNAIPPQVPMLGTCGKLTV